MTRDEAIALWETVVDNGVSASLTGTTLETRSPREHYGVQIHARELSSTDLRSLATIGENHGVGLHLLGDQLSYVEEGRPR
jgi:hypothetical protein